MIKLIEASVSFGSRPILDKVSWMLGDNDRVALVGENGSGKSTLLKVMAGTMGLERGQLEVSRSLNAGYLPQEGMTHKGRTLEQEAMQALGPILALQEEAKKIEARLDEEGLTEDEQLKLIHQMTELLERFQIHDGYEIHTKVRKVLNGLGFSEDDLDRQVETFSGGWQMRVALAKLLLEQPQALLLDEPTNHLDLEARNWLEGYLQEYPYSYLIVSHDRYFIDVTTERIVEVENGRLTDYRGTYSYYLTEKEKRVELQRKAYEKQQEEIHRLKAFINKYKADKKRTGQVHTRMKMLERIDPVEPPRQTKTVHFSFADPPRGPRELIKLENTAKSYGDNHVFDNVDLTIFRGEKVAVVGPNGAGKSTLLEVLAARKEISRGQRKLGNGTHLAIFSQDAGSELEPGETVMECITKNAPFDEVPRLRSLLGAFLFSGDDVDKKVGVLSGGEKSRLALAKLLLRPANLILLDEPTNHLDLRAKEVLMDAFRNYKGALVFVAHDRYFLEGLPDRVIEVYGGQVTIYLGDYSNYLRDKERDLEHSNSVLKQDIADTQTRTTNKSKVKTPKKNLTKAERIKLREKEKEKNRLEQKKKKRLAELESLIADAENEIEELDKQMSDPQLAQDYTKLMDLEQERQKAADKLKKFYSEWEELSSTGE